MVHRLYFLGRFYYLNYFVCICIICISFGKQLYTVHRDYGISKCQVVCRGLYTCTVGLFSNFYRRLFDVLVQTSYRLYIVQLLCYFRANDEGVWGPVTRLVKDLRLPDEFSSGTECLQIDTIVNERLDDFRKFVSRIGIAGNFNWQSEVRIWIKVGSHFVLVT